MAAPDTHQVTDPAAERLAKRLARDLGCSRAQAERWIDAGLVTVDGVVVDTPPTRVHPAQRVALARGASPAALEPFTAEAWSDAIVTAAKTLGVAAIGGTATSTLRDTPAGAPASLRKKRMTRSPR